ncbi:hypothetical protein B4144_0822 [Bacillus atrophaeus]|nr:hypothetical protein B4144_0822 [Bacillus atrophaeus]
MKKMCLASLPLRYLGADAETVRKTLNEKGYTYSNGTINFMQKDGDGGLGYVKYSIDFAPETAIQTKDAEVLGS